MRKLLLLLGLFPAFSMAQHSKCYELENFDEIADCYKSMDNLNEKILEEFRERMKSWTYSEKKR